MKRICAVTEACDRYFHFTRNSIHSFLEKNKWFDGVLYVLVHPELPLSAKNVDALKRFYQGIQIINTALAPVHANYLESFKNRPNYHDVLYASLKTYILRMEEEHLLYFSSFNLFMDHLTSILKSDAITCSPDGPFVVYLDNTKVSASEFYDVLMKESPMTEDGLTAVFFDFIKSQTNYSEGPDRFLKSSQIVDSKFQQLFPNVKRSISIAFDTFRNNIARHAKINQIWLQHNHKVSQFLKLPTNFNKKIAIVPSHNLMVHDVIEPDDIASNLDFKVSIIIPAFRVENYIQECLNSIKLQNVDFPIEILLGIDNCKETTAVVLKIKDKYPNLSVYSSQSNVGPYVMRNSLVKLSNYSNLLFFDSDDIMHPDMIGKLYKNYSNESILRFKYLNFENKKPHLTSSVPHKDVAHGVFFTPLSTFNKIGGFQGWPCGADTEFIKRCQNNKIKTKQINDYLFYRRIHPLSLTQKSSTNHLSTVRSKFKSWIRYNRNWSIPIIPKITNLIKI